MDSITLSGNEFRALASETRTGIIKMLQERNYTLSEMSKKMELSAPTIKQHLSVLEKAELIEQVDEGRKWKYYCLTKKGKKIFKSEQPQNILIVLGTSIIILGIILYSLTGMLSLYGEQPMLIGEKVFDSTITAQNTVPAPAAGHSDSRIAEENRAIIQDTKLPIESIALAIAAAILLSIIIGYETAKARNR